jgi:diguanylate cyclase (GGDEF)-like protein
VSDSSDLCRWVLDSLAAQIAVLDREGAIRYVNRAWIEFGVQNGGPVDRDWIGTDYLDVCRASSSSGDPLAAQAVQGILDVLAGRRPDFRVEYPCDSPNQKRWFMMRLTGLRGGPGDRFVISHHNITERKAAEERVEALSLKDPLTGLANRRHFDRFLADEWRRSRRERSPVSLILFDIDHFKAYNDALGHPAGDRCLCAVSETLHAFSRRPSDLAVRFGGEEFALVLGNIPDRDAALIADRIRERVFERNLCYSDGKRVTISAGVATAVPERAQPEMSLVSAADTALYAAKRGGRNRVVAVGRPA